MAQLCARKGEVESACDHAKQIIAIAGTNASLRRKLVTVRTLLEPFVDVVDVKDLDREISALILPGRQ